MLQTNLFQLFWLWVFFEQEKSLKFKQPFESRKLPPWIIEKQPKLEKRRKFSLSPLVHSIFHEILLNVEEIIYVWMLHVVQVGWTNESENYLKNQVSLCLRFLKSKNQYFQVSITTYFFCFPDWCLTSCTPNLAEVSILSHTPKI